ncbi:hypothetical protein V8C86DRAFT_732461 [Haematococcus lacustris]
MLHMLPLATCQLRAGLLLACSCCKWHDCSTLLQLLLLLLLAACCTCSHWPSHCPSLTVSHTHGSSTTSTLPISLGQCHTHMGQAPPPHCPSHWGSVTHTWVKHRLHTARLTGVVSHTHGSSTASTLPISLGQCHTHMGQAPPPHCPSHWGSVTHTWVKHRLYTARLTGAVSHTHGSSTTSTLPVSLGQCHTHMGQAPPPHCPSHWGSVTHTWVKHRLSTVTNCYEEELLLLISCC